MSLEYSLCPQSKVYLLTVQFMSPLNSLCPKVQLCPQSAVCVPRVQFISHDYSLCPKVQFMTPEYSIYPHRTVYVSTVYVSSVQFMSQEYS